MALVANTWYELSFDSLSAPTWTQPNYAIPGEIVDAVINASSLYCFCTADDGTNSTIVTARNQVAIIPTGSINIVATPVMDTTVMNDGETWYSVRDATTFAWYFYGDQAGFVRGLAAPTTLGAFIS